MSVNLIKSIETLDDQRYWQGYKIHTSHSATCVTAKIDTDRRCCEVFGGKPNTDVQTFVGAEYQSVEVNETSDKERGREIIYQLSVTIHTNRGDLVLSFYNEHNGYYPHDVSVESELGCKIYSI